MFTRASSRESSRSIHRLLSAVKRLSSRPPFNKSQPSSPVSPLRFSYSSSSLDPNSYVYYTDNNPKEAAAWANGEDPKETQRRKFFTNEGRLRDQSPSEKNQPALREGSLRGEKVPGELQCVPSKFFMLFDTERDDLKTSYMFVLDTIRFIFFVTLLIPEPSFTIVFKIDLDNSGDIDRQEFNKVMALMRSQGKQNMEGHRPKVSVEDKGLLEYFFGKDGKRSLKLDRIVQFFRDLHEEVCDLFSGLVILSYYLFNFAVYLVASADSGDINKLLDRVDEIENDTHLKDIKITYKEFKDFAELHKNLQSFSGSLNSYGEVNRVLRKLISRELLPKNASDPLLLVRGISVSTNVLDIIFHVFDANGDGDLSANEFVRVLQRRGGEIQETVLRGLLSCWLNCSCKAFGQNN
ncbi:unnamed protein product [Malus baccata var. baccata]